MVEFKVVAVILGFLTLFGLASNAWFYGLGYRKGRRALRHVNRRVSVNAHGRKPHRLQSAG